MFAKKNMLSFTHSWNNESKTIYSILFSLFCVSIITFIYAVFKSTDAYFTWNLASKIDTLPMAIDSFETGIFQFSIQYDVFLPLQTYFGGDVSILSNITIITFILLIFLVLICLTTLSFLNNFVYYIGTFMCISYLFLQQSDILFTNFSFNTMISLLPILVFGGLSYYFFAFSFSTSFSKRFASFLIVAIFYYGLLFYFADSKNGYFYLFSYASLAAILISICFIAFVAYEIVYGFLKLVSIQTISGSKQGNSVHFVLIFLLYMTNLILQYLKNSNKIDFDLIPINPFYILLTSTLLGIYGFKNRSIMFPKLLPFYPFGAVLYICWAIFCCSTISYFFVTGNDAIIEVFEDAIHLTHIGFGIGFFMYVALNYRYWIDEKLPVSTLVYSHQSVSFYSVYGTGFLIVLTMFFYNSMFAYNQTMAGWYSQIADTYLLDNEEVMSEEYYGKSLRFEFQNHKSNYALASIYRKRSNFKDARYLYEKALLKKPTAFAYCNVAQLYMLDNQTLEAIFKLKKGISQFENSPQLCNNLALLYHQINMQDSALIYLNKSLSIQSLEVIKSNKIALASKIKFKILDTTLLTNSDNMAIKTNILAYKLLNKMAQNKTDKYLADSTLTPENHAYIQNYHIANVDDSDSMKLLSIDKMIQKDTLNNFRNDLVFLKAIKQFYTNNKLVAFRAIDDLQLGNEQTAGKYLNTLGLWALKLELFDMAAQIFGFASNKGEKTSAINQAIAQAEAGNKMFAIQLLQNAAASDTSAAQILTIFGKIYASNYNKVLTENDEIKYQFLHYNQRNLSDCECGNLFFSIQNSKFKYKAGKDLFKKYLQANLPIRCGEIIDELSKLPLNSNQKTEFSILKIKYYIATNDVSNLKLELENTKNTDYWLFANGYLAYSNKKSKDCSKFYSEVSQKLTHDVQVAITTASYFSSIKDNNKSYQILLDAITINPYSATLYKAYTLQALVFGIPSFAENGLAQVQKLVSNSEYLAFKLLYEKEKSKLMQLQ